jgi:DNA-binding IclR family transcriptional regulator
VPEPKFIHGSETSRQAAVAIRPAAGTQRGRVLAYVESCGQTGATDEEIADGLYMNPSSVRPRRGELLEQGLIRDSGKTRQTKAGLRAVVWAAAGAGTDDAGP